MSKSQDIAKILHKYRVGRAMRNQLVEDHFAQDNNECEIFLSGPMDIERRIAGIIASELETPKGSPCKTDRTKDREIIDDDTLLILPLLKKKEDNSGKRTAHVPPKPYKI